VNGGRGRAALFVTIASTAFALSSPIARLARPAHPLFVAFGRVALAAILLFALDPSGVVRHARGVSREVRLRIVACGALLGAHFALFQVGLDRTSLPAAVSLISLEPAVVLVCAFFVHGERPTRREQIGVLLATVGAAIVARGAGTGEHRLGGDLLVLGAVALFGLYVAAARAIKDALPARHAGSLIYGVAAVVVLAALPLFDAMDGARGWPLGSFVAIAAIAVIPTIIGHTSVQAAARTLPPAVVALASPGETLGGLMLGALMLGAMPTQTELVGAAVILSGVLVALFARSSASMTTNAPRAPDATASPGA